MQILKVNSSQNQTQKIEKSLQVLKRGGILCLPTDTVYGLAADAHNEDAVQQIYKLKKRAREKPLVLFPGTHTVLTNLTEKIPPSAIKLISYFWPGPLTLIFQASITEPWCLVSKEGKIGIRIPHHPVARRVSQGNSILLATTSANLSGEEAVSDAQKLSASIKQGVDLILDSGKTYLGKESTVIDVTSDVPRILREASISGDELEKVLEEPLNILFVCTANMCRSVMAEAIFRNIWSSKTSQRIKVRSAGVSALSSFPPSSNTTGVLRKRGIDVISYQSTPVTKKLLNTSHIIFVMEKKHREHLLGIYPRAQNKIWLLKEFSRGEEKEVLDPTGGSEKSYQKVACELEEDIKRIVERICGK